MPHDKIVILEFEEESCEFKILTMFNFQNQSDLEDSGKKFPARGKLRSSPLAGMFGYLSDDWTWVHVEMRRDLPIA